MPKLKVNIKLTIEMKLSTSHHDHKTFLMQNLSLVALLVLEI